MNKEQAKEILKDFLDLNYADREVYRSGIMPDDLSSAFFRRERIQPKRYKVTLEERYGGEDLGSEYWYVFGIEDVVLGTKVFARFNGYYNSYDGHHWDDNDDFQFVKPIEVVVRQWDEI